MEDHVTAVAALAEPTRRRLYDHVVRQPGPVSRDEAAAAVGVPRGTTAFHLDRLVADGLLDVHYERRTGAPGPGPAPPPNPYGGGAGPPGVSRPGAGDTPKGEDTAGTPVTQPVL